MAVLNTSTVGRVGRDVSDQPRAWPEDISVRQGGMHAAGIALRVFQKLQEAANPPVLA